MNTARQRELVLEVEQVRVVRRRMKTSILFCRGCGKSTDFIELVKAAELFGVTSAELYEFVQTNRCHFLAASCGAICVCVADLLAAMSRRLKMARFKLLDNRSS